LSFDTCIVEGDIETAEFFDGWAEGVRFQPSPPANAETSAMTPRPPPGDSPSIEFPVARSETWLLRVGWKRHGKLGPTDAPRTH